MNLEVLCDMLDFPAEVTVAVTKYQRTHVSVLDETLKARLNQREAWPQTIEEIQKRIGGDPFGFSILSELLSRACLTY